MKPCGAGLWLESRRLWLFQHASVPVPHALRVSLAAAVSQRSPVDLDPPPSNTNEYRMSLGTYTSQVLQACRSNFHRWLSLMHSSSFQTRKLNPDTREITKKYQNKRLMTRSPWNSCASYLPSKHADLQLAPRQLGFASFQL